MERIWIFIHLNVLRNSPKKTSYFIASTFQNSQEGAWLLKSVNYNVTSTSKLHCNLPLFKDLLWLLSHILHLYVHWFIHWSTRESFPKKYLHNQVLQVCISFKSGTPPCFTNVSTCYVFISHVPYLYIRFIYSKICCLYYRVLYLDDSGHFPGL